MAEEVKVPVSLEITDLDTSQITDGTVEKKLSRVKKAVSNVFTSVKESKLGQTFSKVGQSVQKIVKPLQDANKITRRMTKEAWEQSEEYKKIIKHNEQIDQQISAINKAWKDYGKGIPQVDAAYQNEINRLEAQKLPTDMPVPEAPLTKLQAKIEETKAKMQELADEYKKVQEAAKNNQEQINNKQAEIEKTQQLIEAEKQRLTGLIRQRDQERQNYRRSVTPEIKEANLAKWQNTKAQVEGSRAAIETYQRQLDAAKTSLDRLNAAQEQNAKDAANIKSQYNQLSAELGNEQKEFQKLQNISKVVNGFKKVGDAVKNVTHRIRELHGESRRTSKDINKHFSHLGKNILQFGFGFRSLYFLIKRLRTIFIEGLENIGKKSESLNDLITNFKKSVNGLKGSFAAAFQPIVQTALPVLIKIVNKIQEILELVAKLNAVLVGQHYYYKVIATDIEKANDALKDQLGTYDQLQVIQKDNTTSTDNPGYEFEKVDIPDAEFAELESKLDSILDLVIKIAAGLAAWKISKLFLSNLQAAGVVLMTIGAIDFVDNIKDIAENGLDLKNIVRGAIDGAMIAAGLDFTFFKGKNLGGAITVGVGISLVVEGITSIISEGFTPENVITTLSGIVLGTTGIISIVKKFNKNVVSNTPDLQTMPTNMDTVNNAVTGMGTGAENLSNTTSKLTPKLVNFMKNLGLGLIIMLEAIGAVLLFVGSIILLGKELEQVAIAWEPLKGKGDEIKDDIITGTALLAGIGLACGGIGTLGTELIIPMALGALTLGVIGLSATVFIAEIIGVGKGLQEIQRAWEPIHGKGDEIKDDIITGTGILVGIGAVCGALGVATVASFGLLPLAIGVGTGLLKELAWAVDEFCDYLEDTAVNLIDLYPPLKTLNNILPDLSLKLDQYRTFLRGFAQAVVDITKSSLIASIGETLRKIIEFFVGDPIKSLYNEITDQIDEFSNLIDALEIINPMIEKATKLVGTYKENMGNFESESGTGGGFLGSLVGGAKNAINKIIGFFEAFANVGVKAINWVIDGLNKISFEVPDWVLGIGGKTFGFNIKRIPEVQIPRLAQGAVLPPNREFLATLGDQRHGTNIEAPLDTIKQALVEALKESGGNREPIILKLNGKTIAQVVWDESEKMYKQTGKLVYSY